MGFRGDGQGAEPLVEDGDYEAKGDKTDGDKSKDEGRSVSRVEWAIPR